MMQRKNKNWSEYPPGTKAYAINGGYWLKLDNCRWKWCNGDSFPTPGGDAIFVELPVEQIQGHLNPR